MASVGIVSFPGSIGIRELREAYERNLDAEVNLVSYLDENIKKCDLLVLPGGSAFGDALRPGALVRLAPIAPSIRRFARGGRVLGIGNGFQILCELGILKGSFLTNKGGLYVSSLAPIRFEHQLSYLEGLIDPGAVMRLPVGCYSGAWYADRRTFNEIEEQQLVVARYCDEDGAVDEAVNPCGALGNVAALTNPEKNVLGIMPHPERAMDRVFGSEDGSEFLRLTLP